MMKKLIFLMSLIAISITMIYSQDSDSEQKIIDILLAHDKRSVEENYKISYIRKVNIGIPEGDNWVAVWIEKKRDYGSRVIHCYSINDGEIKYRYVATSPPSVQKYSQIDIFQDVPGIQIDEGCVVGDFNGDGLDELLFYGYWGGFGGLVVQGFGELSNSDIITYGLDWLCQVESRFISPEGPSPIEFITYKGMKGFKLYCFFDERKNNSPKNIINGYYAWYFFTWDADTRKYIEVEEFDPEYVEGESIVEPENSHLVNEPQEKVEPEMHQTVLVPESADKAEPAAENETVDIETPRPPQLLPADSGKDVFSVLWVSIGAGVLVIAGAVAIIIIRMRKKRWERIWKR